MIRVFLVEDEILIRNGIKNSIEWGNEGYQFVGEASHKCELKKKIYETRLLGAFNKENP